jgi:hypothetical protein
VFLFFILYSFFLSNPVDGFVPKKKGDETKESMEDRKGEKADGKEKEGKEGKGGEDKEGKSGE